MHVLWTEALEAGIPTELVAELSQEMMKVPGQSEVPDGDPLHRPSRWWE